MWEDEEGKITKDPEHTKKEKAESRKQQTSISPYCFLTFLSS
jgi:hypothetical protein